MPAIRHPLVYTCYALQVYAERLAYLPWTMFLSSGFSEHTDSRFDILVADPIVTLVTYGEKTFVTKATGTKTVEGDPLSLLQTEFDALGFSVFSDDLYPFQGGAVGLLGYDLGRRFERLPEKAQADLKTPDMAIGLYDWALIADHKEKTLTLIDHVGGRIAWLEALPKASLGSDFRLLSAWQSNMTQKEYQHKFDQIQAWIQSGDCYQVNLAQRFHARYEGDEWIAFLHLNQANRAPFSAFLRLLDSVILSFSPERFLSLNASIIEARPIKGTLPRLEDVDQDRIQAEKLAKSEKDRAENLMIVDLLRNDIGRVAETGSVQVPELFGVESFPAIHHLVSTIRASLKTTLTATDLLRACFPGGSITGAPKIRAMEIIETLEPHRRNAWCGSIGYLSLCGRMDTNIGIRTLVAEQNQLFCTAGGGIVADSNGSAEYEETLHKIKRILPVLEEFSGTS